jgi:hypothetical protein
MSLGGVLRQVGDLGGEVSGKMSVEMLMRARARGGSEVPAHSTAIQEHIVSRLRLAHCCLRPVRVR